MLPGFMSRGTIPGSGARASPSATAVASGEGFGEVAFLDGGRRSADAEAAVRTWLYVITRERFERLEREHPEVAAKIFERIAIVTSQRLRLADAELRMLEER